ncbi:MAG: magnesium transporter [Candidatus Cyclobacteriaceae bacterium M2_1C_046]
MDSVNLKQRIEDLPPENFEQLKYFIKEEATNSEIAEYINYHWEAIEDQPNLIKKIFATLKGERAVKVFERLEYKAQCELLDIFPKDRITYLLNEISPDDRTALFEKMPQPVMGKWLNILNETERKSAIKLLNYDEDTIGRLMTTEFVQVQPEWTCKEAIEHIRAIGHDSETINVIYVVDETHKLIDDLRIREILLANPNTKIKNITDDRFVSLNAYNDQETAIRVFKETDRYALPVTDFDGTLVGIVTVDDLLDVMEREDTEDIHKMGGSEALDEPYFSVSLFKLIKKRAGWLIVLFFGLMLTATAMSYFEDAIASAVVLTLFIPLIIASGGNSGSQAATIITRALALEEVSLKQWWRVMKREVVSGLSLGIVLGSLGALRVIFGGLVTNEYGDHWGLLAITIGVALVGVVLWGTLMGSLLPLLLQRLGFDPAVSSVPFISTLVDVTGIVIYFSTAYLFLGGILL